jgi:hypothetical protein
MLKICAKIRANFCLHNLQGAKRGSKGKGFLSLGRVPGGFLQRDDLPVGQGKNPVPGLGFHHMASGKGAKRGQYHLPPVQVKTGKAQLLPSGPP